MKQRKIVQLAMSALIAIWIAGSLSVTALNSLGISGAWQALAVCALAALFGVLVSMGRVAAVVTGIITVGAGVWLGVSNLEGIQAFVAQLPQYLAGDWGGMNMEQLLLPAVLVLAAVWTLFVFASTHTGSGGFISMVLVLLYWLLLRALAGSISVPLMLITLIGVAALFAVPTGGFTNYAKALLPTAIVAALLAVVLLPAEGTTYRPLEDMAERVRNVFNSYFSFTDTRVPYSISMDGYHPLGETLGGPAEPNDWPIMQVVTDSDLYLRGTIRRTYVNTAWTDAVASNRYRFGDITKLSVREDVFEDDRVDVEASEGAFKRIEAEIDMMTAGTSTLFVPHRLESLKTALDIAVYYNSVGDVFITRDVQEGDSYSLEAVVPAGNAHALEDYIEARRLEDDESYAQAAAEYMQLPKYIEQGVYELVQQITAGALTDYQKATAIEKYLEENYTYTLDVDMPRTDRDFVSEFLLGSKKGYCSYFASAMAVMGRIAGLPTRYVEGYRVQANPLGVSTVTGENAHAWVEVYMNGVGWVTFDPTPGSGYESDEAMDQHEAEGDGEEDAESTEPPVNADEPTADPTQEPTDPPIDDEPTAEPLDGTENPSAEPTEEPTLPPLEADDPTPPPENDDVQDDRDDERDWLKMVLAVLIALLIILLLLALAYLRLKMSDPRLVAAKYRDDCTMQLMVYYRAMLTLLEMLGQVPESGESPVAFGKRLARTGVADRSFVEVTNRLSYGQYAGKGVNADDVSLAAQTYAGLVRQLRGGERLRWLWARLRHGMGSVEQIP